MVSWFSSQQSASVMVSSEGHHPSSATMPHDDVPVVLSEAERTFRRCARIRSVPCVYLKCPPERKQNEQFAMAALMGLDHHSHRRDEVLRMVLQNCPHIFENRDAMLELFQQGTPSGIEHIVQRMSLTITWDLELSIVAIERTIEIYRCLPLAIRTHDEIIKRVAAHHCGGNHLGRFAPAKFLVERPDLILKTIHRGFRTMDIPLELRRNKEFVIKSLEVTSVVLLDSPSELMSDKDVLLAAASRENGMLMLESAFKRHVGNPKKVLVPFAEEIKSKLDSHVAFQSLLHCISVAGRSETMNPLQLLLCGEETTTAMKIQIAEFLNAPTKWNEVARMKSAWEISLSKYYNAHLKAESERQNRSSDERAQSYERKLGRQQRMHSRSLLVFVRRDLGTARVEMGARRDHPRALQRIQEALNIEGNVERRMNFFDTDSDSDSDGVAAIIGVHEE